MMEGIKRIVTPSDEEERYQWDSGWEIKPGTELEIESPEEEILTSEALTPEAHAPTTPAKFISNDTSALEYQKSTVRAAIEQGGKLGNHEISVPWLMMILSGLEGHPVETEAMWEYEAPVPTNPVLPDAPSYADIFPVEKETVPDITSH